MRSRSDVVIVGGGIVGASIAYNLADEGTSVTIIERDSVASHASGFSGGYLNPTSETGKLVPRIEVSLSFARASVESGSRRRYFCGFLLCILEPFIGS